MIRRSRSRPDDDASRQAAETIRQLSEALTARDRRLRRVGIALAVTGMVLVIAAFVMGNLLRDTYPFLSAAANALGGTVYLSGTFVALVEAAGRRKEHSSAPRR